MVRSHIPLYKSGELLEGSRSGLKQLWGLRIVPAKWEKRFLEMHFVSMFLWKKIIFLNSNILKIHLGGQQKYENTMILIIFIIILPWLKSYNFVFDALLHFEVLRVRIVFCKLYFNNNPIFCMIKNFWIISKVAIMCNACGHWKYLMIEKNPAYGRNWISLPMRIVAHIPKRTEMDRKSHFFYQWIHKKIWGRPTPRRKKMGGGAGRGGGPK